MNLPTFLLMGFIVFISSSLLYGCDNNQPQKTAAIKKEIRLFKKAAILKGLVRDNQGLVKKGIVKATNDKKQVIARAKLQGDGSYKIEIPAKTPLPILLTVYDQDNETKSKELMVAVAYTSMSKFHINPLSTKIAQKAKTLGGYTHANLMLAAQSMVDMPDYNKRSTQGFRGDSTKQYGGWH